MRLRRTISLTPTHTAATISPPVMPAFVGIQFVGTQLGLPTLGRKLVTEIKLRDSQRVMFFDSIVQAFLTVRRRLPLLEKWS